MKDISFKAVLAGATAGMFVSFMGSMIVGVFGAIAFRLLDAASSASSASFNERLMAWPAYIVGMLVVGALGDVFSGFIGGLVGRAAPRKNGVAAALLALVLMLPMLPSMFETQPLWFTIVAYVLVVPSAWLGARVAMALAPKKKKKAVAVAQ